MIRLSKVWLVARYEFIYNFTRRSYLFAAFVLPFIIGALIFVGTQIVVNTESNLSDFVRVGYVDPSGLLRDAESERFVAYGSRAEVEAAFQTDEVDAYFILADDYAQTGNATYYSTETLVDALGDEFRDFIRASLASESDLSERLQDPVSMRLHLLDDDEPLSVDAAVLRVALPIVFAFLLIFNTITSGQFLLAGVSEEKETRIVEILMTSIRPTEIIAGKAIGLSGLLILQISFWLVGGLLLGAATGRLDALNEASLDPFLLLMAVVYFTLITLMFAGIMIGIGSIASAEEEARQFSSVFVVLTILPPSWGIILFLENPDHPLVTFMSLFPLTAPAANMILLGIGESEIWQIVASITILLVTIAAIYWFAGKVFRIGMLNAGQRLSLRQIALIMRGA